MNNGLHMTNNKFTVSIFFNVNSECYMTLQNSYKNYKSEHLSKMKQTKT